MSILYCDLVGSTKLSRELDPEDLREVFSAYRNRSTSVVGHFGGTVSRIIGDALVVLFGYPMAHADHAERSVGAGLELTRAIASLDLGVIEPGLKLAVRVGIASGEVVIGDLIGEDTSERQSMIGLAPNLAEQLQAIAEPNGVIVAEGTWSQVEGGFDGCDLGSFEFSGFGAPVRAFRVDRRHPFPSAVSRGPERGGHPNGRELPIVASGPRETAEPERRQLTVLFCDLVDSTTLARELDPEDLRDVLRAYQGCCSAVVEHFGGSVSRIVGDALLVLFGFPEAHEDDPERSVHAGLELIRAVSDLALGALLPGRPLSLRVGIATGLVVVGDLIGEGAAEHESVVGLTPNLAARLQAIAEANSVIVAEATWALVQGLFEYQDLGTFDFKGFAEAQRAFRVDGVRPVESRFEARREVRGVTSLVGRRGEEALLRDRWESAGAGHGSVVRIVGEPGIGKSRLVGEMRKGLDGPHVLLSYYCSEYHRNTAWFPVVNEIERSAGFASGDPPETKMRKLQASLFVDGSEDANWLYQSLLSPAGADAGMENETPERRKIRTLRVLEQRIEGLAREKPVLVIFEDVHWSDSTTLEFLEDLAGLATETALLLLITHRPEFRPQTPHLQNATTIVLDRLLHGEAAKMVGEVTSGKALPPRLMRRILTETSGIPLFIEELTRSVLEAGFLIERVDRYVLEGSMPAFAIPSTLQDSLMARLDRLKGAKRIAQVGAVIGREFSLDLLRRVANLEEDVLSRSIDQLAAAQLIHAEDARAGIYAFKHALIKDAAYASLLRRQRRELHQRIAHALETGSPTIKANQPELIARHYTEAGLAEPALPYWLSAGSQAARRSANLEATDHLESGLSALAKVPESGERDRIELELRTNLGPALIATRGYVAPDVESAYHRARDLAERIGDSAQRVRVLRGLWAFYIVRADLELARETGQQIQSLAEVEGHPDYLVEAQRALGQAHFYLGNFTTAETYLKRTLELYESGRHEGHAVEYGNEPKAVALSYLGWADWCLGYPNRALHLSLEAIRQARRVGHPFTIAQVMVDAMYVHALRRDYEQTRLQAEEVMAYAHEQGFPYWRTIAEIFNAWSRAQGSGDEHALATMKRSLADYEATGSRIAYPWFAGLLAEALGARGEVVEALDGASRALTIAGKTREGYAHPELYRIQGELLQKLDRYGEAEVSLKRALEGATDQGARSWQLRSAMSLMRLSQMRRGQADVRSRLSAVIRDFPETGPTADYTEALQLMSA